MASAVRLGRLDVLVNNAGSVQGITTDTPLAEAEAFQSRYGVKAFHFESRAQAAALVREACRSGLRLVLQEYIPGPPSNHYFLDGFMDRSGVVCACIISQRLRMFPPDFGDGTASASHLNR